MNFSSSSLPLSSSLPPLFHRHVLFFRSLVLFLLLLSFLFCLFSALSSSWFTGFYESNNHTIIGALDSVKYHVGPFHQCLSGFINTRPFSDCSYVSIDRLNDDEGRCIAFNYQQLTSCERSFAFRVVTRAFLVLQLINSPIILIIAAVHLCTTIRSGWLYIKRVKDYNTAQLVKLSKISAWLSISLSGVGALFLILIISSGSAGYEGAQSHIGAGYSYILVSFFALLFSFVLNILVNRPGEQALMYPEDEENEKEMEENKISDNF
jgi:hypothetical protein